MQKLVEKAKLISFHFSDGRTKTITKKEGEKEIQSFLELIQERGFQNAVIIETKSRGENVIPHKISIDFR